MRGTVKTVAALGIAALLAAGCAKPATSTVATQAKFKACMVTDIGGINDKSFNQTSWAGMTAAQKTGKVASQFLQSTSSADYAKNISTFEAKKCGVIVTVGFLMGPATQAAALADPQQKFAIVDCSYASFCLSTKPHPPIAHNIDQLVFNTAQDAFLSGYLAAGMTKTGVVATYGGAKFGTVTIYMDGFWDGVQYYNKVHNKHVQVLGWSEPKQSGVFVTGAANPFNAQAQGASIATTFINHRADVIFPVAGGTGLGSAAAVKTANASGKHVAMYWVDTDGCLTAPQDCSIFITSVEKGLAAAVKSAVLSAASGQEPTMYVGTLQNGGAVLAPFHAPWNTLVPASLQSEINALRQKIIAGQITIATKSPV